MQATAQAKQTTKAADDLETAHIVKRAGGSSGTSIPRSGAEWQRLTDTCAYGDRWSTTTQAACNVVSPDAEGGLVATVGIAFAGTLLVAVAPEAAALGGAVKEAATTATIAAKNLWDRLQGTTSVAGASGEAPSIEISASRLQKILDMHVDGGTLTAGKSTFFSGDQIAGLVKAANGVTPTVQANGRLAFVVDAGSSVGIDRVTGLLTSTYTVITDASRNVVTVFPGAP